MSFLKYSSIFVIVTAMVYADTPVTFSTMEVPASSTAAPKEVRPADAKATALLEQVREDLRITDEAAQQVRSRLSELTLNPTSEPDLIKEYADYLQRLEALSAAHRSKLADLEKLYKEHSQIDESEASTPLELDEDEKWSAPDQPVVEAGSVEALEAELRQSLGEFDDFLLREQDVLSTGLDQIAAQAQTTIEDLTAKARESAETLKDKGEKPPEVVKPKPKEKPADKKPPPPPSERRGDPETDDVVARQLREAAENEKDPELREKLWAEYDAYKEGISP